MFCLGAGRIRLMGSKHGMDGCPEAKGGWVGLGKRGCVREDTAREFRVANVRKI